MAHFELTILGTSSSQPAFNRFPTSQVLQCGNQIYMIDCGEGCQMQLSKYNIKRGKLSAIFISHMHGDHIYGLPGVLTSFMHFNRENELKIIGPYGIKNYIEACLSTSEAFLGFPLTINEFDASIPNEVYSNEKISVRSVPLKHNVPTMGFVFTENVNYLRLDKSKIEKLNLDFEEMRMLKSGQNINRPKGEIILSSDVCLPKNEAASYAFLSDTTYDESIVPHIKNVMTIYHETTYLDDMADEAMARMHSTSKQAAKIAKAANVGMLICGHYSSRYKSIDEFEVECKEIFAKSVCGREGMVVKIGS